MQNRDTLIERTSLLNGLQFNRTSYEVPNSSRWGVVLDRKDPQRYIVSIEFLILKARWEKLLMIAYKPSEAMRYSLRCQRQ